EIFLPLRNTLSLGLVPVPWIRFRTRMFRRFDLSRFSFCSLIA
ncbi:unnamed protein product, partial [marine sediment metagenome]